MKKRIVITGVPKYQSGSVIQRDTIYPSVGNEMLFRQHSVLGKKPYAIVRESKKTPPRELSAWEKGFDLIDRTMSYPARKTVELITGKYQDPSEALGIKNKWGKLATDILLDPMNLIPTTAVMQLVKNANKGIKVIDNSGNVITALKNVGGKSADTIIKGSKSINNTKVYENLPNLIKNSGYDLSNKYKKYLKDAPKYFGNVPEVMFEKAFDITTPIEQLVQIKKQYPTTEVFGAILNDIIDIKKAGEDYDQYKPLFEPSSRTSAPTANSKNAMKVNSTLTKKPVIKKAIEQVKVLQQANQQINDPTVSASITAATKELEKSKPDSTKVYKYIDRAGEILTTQTPLDTFPTRELGAQYRANLNKESTDPAGWNVVVPKVDKKQFGGYPTFQSDISPELQMLAFQNPAAVRDSIARVESGGQKDPYKARNPDSTATGKYQFIWSIHRKELEKLYGIKSREEFENNPKIQEDYMDRWTKNTLEPGAIRLRKLYPDTPYTDEELGALIHYHGEGGARKALREGTENKAYLKKFNEGRASYQSNPTSYTEPKQVVQQNPNVNLPTPALPVPGIYTAPIAAAQGQVNPYRTHGDPYEYIKDPNGVWQYRKIGEQGWHNVTNKAYGILENRYIKKVQYGGSDYAPKSGVGNLYAGTMQGQSLPSVNYFAKEQQDIQRHQAKVQANQRQEWQNKVNAIKQPLSVAAAMPVVGAPAGALLAGMDLAAGDYKNAAINAAGALTGGIGKTATAARGTLGAVGRGAWNLATDALGGWGRIGAAEAGTNMTANAMGSLKMKLGGEPHIVSQDDLTPLQAERGEFVIHPNFDVTKVAAKLPHHKMGEDVTDTLMPQQTDEQGNIIAPGAFVVSRDKAMKIPYALADQLKLGIEPAFYSEDKQLPQAKVLKASELLFKNKKDQTPAELVKNVLKLYPKAVRDNDKDIFAAKATQMNKQSRIVPLTIIKELNTMMKNVKEINDTEQEIMKYGGTPKYQFEGEVVYPPMFPLPGGGVGGIIPGMKKKDFQRNEPSFEFAELEKYYNDLMAAEPDTDMTNIKTVPMAYQLAQGATGLFGVAAQDPTSQIYSDNPALVNEAYKRTSALPIMSMFDNAQATQNQMATMAALNSGVNPAQITSMFSENRGNLAKAGALTDVYRENQQIDRSKAARQMDNQAGVTRQINENIADRNRKIGQLGQISASTLAALGNINAQAQMYKDGLKANLTRDKMNILQALAGLKYLKGLAAQ